MKSKQHHILHWFLAIMIAAIAVILLIRGYSYYSTTIEQRYFHPDHEAFKASGFIGHGLGIIGTLMIVVGVFMYMGRKRIKLFSRIGVLKYWLEFHIFLCVLGPILVLFHTSFKFGGLVAIGFWSMVAVVASGVVGRFIYLQIPRTIQGRVLTLHELNLMKKELNEKLRNNKQLTPSFFNLMTETMTKSYPEGFRHWISNYREERSYFNQLCVEVKKHNLTAVETKNVVHLFRSEIGLNRRIRRLATMLRYFQNWHIIHLPFALIMLVVMMIHVGVSLFFGYKWIF